MKKNNKLFTKISTIVVSLAMALGVGVAAASNGGFRRAEAAVSTYQHIFNAKPSTGNNVTLSGISWTVAATNLGSYNSANYAGVQLGSSGSNGEITLTSSSSFSYSSKTVVKEVRLWLNLGGTSVTPSVSVGGTAATSDGTTVIKNSKAGSDYTKATRVKFTPATGHDTGVVVISVTTVKAGYICAMEIDVDSAVAGYRVSYDKNTTDTVTGMPNSHDGLEDSTVQSLTVNPAPERWGYTFGGWAATNDSNTPIESVTINGADATVYAIWNEDHTVAGKYSDNPYTVAQARAAIDSGTTEEKTGVYVHGIVSEIVTAFDAEHGNISYNISVDGETTSDQLQAYRGKSYNGDNFESADNIQVGDEVVVKGNLTKYNDTYEFAANNQLVSGAASYTVTNNIANTSCPISSIRQNQALNVTLSANEHFTLPSELTVTMGGNTLSSGAHYSYNSETGAFSINSVTGNVVISGSAVEDPKYTVTYLPGEGSGENYVSEPQYAGSYTLATFASTGLVKPTGKAFKSWLVGEVEKQPNETIEITNANIQVTALYKNVETYSLFTGTLVEGDYVITYDGGAINTTIDSNKLQITNVAPENDIITDPDPSIVWHLAKVDDNWSIYNSESNKYLSAKTAKNTAQLVNDTSDNHALWGLDYDSENGTYDFLNVGRPNDSDTPANIYLRRNGNYGFACYGSGTGNKLTLYKLQTPELSSITTTSQSTTFTAGNTFSYGGTLTAHYTLGKADATVAPTSFHLDSVDGTAITNQTVLTYAAHNGHEIYVVYTEGGVTKSAHYLITVNYAAVESVSITTHAASISLNGEYDVSGLEVTVNGQYANQGYEWVVSNATNNIDYEFENGLLVVGNDTGTVTLRVRSTADNTKYDELVVTITGTPSVTLNKDTVAAYTGDTVSLAYASVSNMGVPTSYAWEIVAGSDKVAISGSADASTVSLTCNTAGTATVKLTVSDGLHAAEATAEITVSQSTATLGEITSSDGNKLYLGTAKNSLTLSTQVNVVGNAQNTVTWSSSNEDIATVENGVVTANSAGDATITARSSTGDEKTFAIIVLAPNGLNLVSAPTKTTYKVGETLEIIGLIVNATFADQTELELTTYNLSDVDMSTAGKKEVTISSFSNTAKFEITVAEYYTKLTDVSTLAAGDEILIVAKKSNDYYAATGELISSSSRRLQKVTTTVTENGIAKIDELATAAFRVYEQDGKFALMTSTGKFLSNSSTANEMSLADDPVFVTFSVENEHIAVSFGENGAAGRMLYNSNSQWFSTYTSNTSASMLLPDIYVIKGNGTNPSIPKHVTGIEVTAQPTKTTYEIGEDLDTSGLVVTAKYSDGTSEALASTDYELSKFHSSDAGEKTIVVTYQGFTATFKVTVNASQVTPPEPTKTLESISIEGPTTTTYTVGEDLNKAGLVVTAHYSDQSTAAVTNYTITGYDKTTAGTQTVTVSYTEGEVTKTATFTVTVNEGTQPQPEDLSAAKEAAINELHDFFLAINQDEYDLAGQTALGRAYDDGIAAINAATSRDAIATALTNAKAALNAVEKAGTPAEVTLSSIAVSGDYKTDYTVGDTFNPAGLVVTATYSDGTTANVALSDVTISGFSTETAGTITVTVSYNGKTATFTVTVSAAQPQPDPLDTAKANALSELDTVVAGLNESDYDAASWASIQAAIEAARSGIRSAEDEATVATILSQVKSAVEAVKTIAQIEDEAAQYAAALAAAKEQALAALQEYYNSFNADDYDEAGLAALAAAYNNGKDAINNATDIYMVTVELRNAKAALDAVETKPAEQPAKKRCGGDIAATSIILSTLALAGGGLLVFKKRKED